MIKCLFESFVSVTNFIIEFTGNILKVYSFVLSDIYGIIAKLRFLPKEI